MNVIVIGLGSMGKRRIRLIQKIHPEYVITGVDTSSQRCDQAAKTFAIPTSSCLDEALTQGADCAFVCTSPITHHGIINKCLQKNLHVFTELNLVADGYEENMHLAQKNERILFLSSTFLYRDEIEYIKQRTLASNCLLNYSYHVGQYLPDWHPWENYKDFFVNNRRTNGCREIFAIEFPWLTDIFGELIDVIVQKGKASRLDIDYNDHYLLLTRHASGVKGLLAVDVLSRKPVRNFELFGEELYISWDGSPHGLYEYNCSNKENIHISLYESLDKLSGYSNQIIENAYQKEILNFLKAIEGVETQRYSFEKDLHIIEWINRIELDY